MAVDALARALAAGKVPVTAYEMAVKAGYTGTEEQFAEDMGNSGTNATNAAASASAAAASAESVSASAAQIATNTSDISDLKTQIDGGIVYNYIENKNIDATTGELVDETGTSTSDYIPYTWTGSASYDCGDNTKLTYRIEFYDANKNHLNGFRNPSSTGGVTYRGINAETQVIGTVGYVRFSFKTGTTGRIFTTNNTIWTASATTTNGLRQMVGDLDTLTTSEKTNLVGAINEVAEEIPDISLPITPSDTDFFYTSPNILDPYNVVNGQYVNQTNGEFASNASYSRTGFIPVTGGQKYCIISSDDYNAGIRYAFYTSASTDTYISGDNVNIGDVGNLVTAPATAKYMVMSAVTTRFPFMIAQSDTKIAYQEYGVEYILPEYVLGEDLSDLIVNLPSKIYATVGFETNIYYENIVDNWEQYNFNISCSIGKDMKRGYTITPQEADVGTYTLTIMISSKTSGSMKTASTTLVVSSASAGSGTTVNVLVLGDSTTANGTVITKLHENFSGDSMTVNTVGTLGTAPNNMEGRGGWTFDFYCTLASRNSVINPFYNANKSGDNKFDAGFYFTQTGVTKPDWFLINLGINDMFEYTNDGAVNAKIESCITQCDEMIESIKAVSPSPKIGICITIPPNDSQDAFGKAYGCGQTRNRYKRNNLLWVKRLIAEYDSRENEGIYLIPIHTNLDTVFNMGMEALPVNARNTVTTYQSPIANGGVHPVESGYWQIADVYTAFLKGNVS